MRYDAKEVLGSYIDALYPIVYINHFDFKTVDELITNFSAERKIVEFVEGIGMVDFLGKSLIQNCNINQFLSEVLDNGYRKPMLIILKDVHEELKNIGVISLLKSIAYRNMYVEGYSASIFIVSSKLVVPKELEEFITIYDFPLPDEKRIHDIINEYCDMLDITIKEKVVDELTISLKGLNEFQIKQILNLAYQDGGLIDSDDKQLILGQKEQLIKKSGLLEMIRVDDSISDIGGLENLKEWLYNKEQVFKNLEEAIKFGVDIPKGILIVGMPGCGKSLTAKSTADLFGMPLVRLDVGRLLGKYVGESESNMREALKLAEAISPCVLWIDEIEKAFSGIGGIGGASDVTTRLFGQFLTWMQEKKNLVFIVATANDISKIPAEFLRKGRFDELFYVDLPNAEERRKIIEIHLKKRNKLNDNINIISIVKETGGYNGADLEAIVKEAIETCFIEGKEFVETEDLLKSKENIKSISATLKDRIQQIKDAVKDMDLKPASSKDGKIAYRHEKVNRSQSNGEIQKDESLAENINEIKHLHSDLRNSLSNYVKILNREI